MLLNLTRLGMLDQASKSQKSLIGYLNKYNGGFMASSIKSIDFLNEKSLWKSCGDQGCSF